MRQRNFVRDGQRRSVKRHQPPALECAQRPRHRFARCTDKLANLLVRHREPELRARVDRLAILAPVQQQPRQLLGADDERPTVRNCSQAIMYSRVSSSLNTWYASG